MTRRVVLAGAGHAHALVLRDWARAPRPGVELVVVAPQRIAPYSGMVPGWLAGAYRDDEIGIDFGPLCAAAGARFVAGELDAVDPAQRVLRLADGRAIDWALLSLNVGSTLRPPPLRGATVLALRPLAKLHAAYAALLAAWQAEPSGAPCTVTAVGGGAAGFEALLAVLARLRALRPDRAVQGRLVSRAAQLLPGFAPAARRAATRALDRAGVELQLGRDAEPAAFGAGDIVLWATGAEAHDWQRDAARRGGLAVDAEGFLRVDAALRSVSHPQVFAAGDCARWTALPGPLPKAGVYAVRMGPVLAHNLRAALAGQAPQPYRPQREVLSLLATADGRAIASRGAFAAAGAWAWRWKDRIDRGFVRGFASP